MTNFKTRKKDKRVFPTSDSKSYRKDYPDDSERAQICYKHQEAGWDNYKESYKKRYGSARGIEYLYGYSISTTKYNENGKLKSFWANPNYVNISALDADLKRDNIRFKKTELAETALSIDKGKRAKYIRYDLKE